MEETQKLYIGFGVSSYDDSSFVQLPRAVGCAEALGGLLADRHDYSTAVVPNPTEDQARETIQQRLGVGLLPPGSALVLLWCGHGVVAPEAFRLIAKDSRKNAAPELTPDYIAGYLARCGATQVLLLVDACNAGAGVLDVQKVVNLVRREKSENAWFGILASAGDFQRARDGVFVDRLLELLSKGPSDPVSRQRWSSHNEGIRGDDVIEVMQREWGDPGQTPTGDDHGLAFPMFPNPYYDRYAPSQVVEHLLLSAEGRAPDEEGIYFTGRKAQLGEIVEWMQSETPGVFLVTGPAGSGKSAIVGRIASLSNPRQRERLTSGPLEHADPGERSVDAQVHARGLTADQVVKAVDEQLVHNWVLGQRAEGGWRNRGELLGALERLEVSPLIVLDGLDEAGTEAWAIAKDVVGVLAGVARFLVSSRRLPPRAEDEPGLLQALAATRTMDLGKRDFAESTREDVFNYVGRRLAGVSETMDSAAVGNQIVQLSDQENEGAFLLARVVTSQLRTDPVDTSVDGWERQLSRSLEQAFARDVESIEPALRARELLRALAWSYGSGFPDDLWPIVSTALSETDFTFTRDDAYRVLSVAGRYIVEDGDGTRAVYRLTHQRLVDLLHPNARPVEFGIEQARASRVAEALVEHYLGILEAGVEPTDRSYLWRYVWRHCTDGGAAGIDALRRLTEARPAAFLPNLAGALNNLGNRYSAVGKRAEALGPTEEAVETYRELAKENAAAFFQNFLITLRNLGNRYREAGREDEIEGMRRRMLAFLPEEIREQVIKLLGEA